LDSILAQEYNDLEVIIADDHSTDRTLELCHKYDDKLNMIYITTKPRGMHCPNNTRLDGFNATSYDSDWITFID
jgi:glycosyltransferase involved in cell wall biosynthesis